jgi:hypothetical protein
MADQEEQPAPPDEGAMDYNELLNLRHARFRALGGGQDIQQDLKDASRQLLLKDQVTDQHRKIVYDLAAGGLSNQDVADVMGISKERLQTLFDYEIKAAYQLCHSSLARSLYFLGIAGDGRAAADWLRLHNRSKWATKTLLSGSEDGAPIKTEDSGSKTLLTKLLAGMATDKKLTRPSKPSALPAAVTKKDVKQPGVQTTKPRNVRKPRDETK